MKKIAKFERVSLARFKDGCTRENSEQVYEEYKATARRYDCVTSTRRSR